MACFEDVSLDFTDENGDPCKWVAIVGENGTGKSTVLATLAFALDYRDAYVTSDGGQALTTKLSGALGGTMLPQRDLPGSFRTAVRSTIRDRWGEPGKITPWE